MLVAGLLALAGCGAKAPESAGGADAPTTTTTGTPDAAPVAGTPGCRNGTIDPGEACDHDPQCGRSAHCTPACTCVPLDPAPAATAQVTIDAALRAGDIDLGEALLFRGYALYRDPRLPERFDGVGLELEDLSFHQDVRNAWAQLSPSTQAALQPFMVRPSAPDSIFSTGYGGGLASAAAGKRLAQGGGVSCPTPSACAEWQSSDSTHFRVWSCGDDADGTRAATVADAESIYAPMSAYMGEPVPDEEDNADGVAKIDIYLVEPNQSHVRGGACVALADHMGAGTVSAPPSLIAGGSGETITSGYILMPLAKAASSDRKPALVHEFFHVQQLAHSQGAMSSWLAESTATWAERHFLPDDENARLEVYSYFPKHAPDVVGSGFLARVARPLDIGPPASYEAFIWHYFAEQESSASVVAEIWTRIANGGYGGSGYNGAVNATTPFADHFGAFILRNLNRDAVKSAGAKLYKDLDRRFPDANDIPALEEKDKLEAGITLLESVSIEHLAASYVHLTVADTVHEITFDFTDVSGGDKVDIELLLSKTPEGIGGWKAKELKGQRKLTLCRDSGDDPVYEAYIALGNHDWQGESTVTGSYQVTGKAVCCPPGQTCWSGMVNATTGFSALGSTTTTTAHVTFAYDPVLFVYTPIEGRVDVNEDVVTDQCASHVAGAAGLGPMDGSIILTDSGQYLAEGSASVDLAGTTGCGGSSEPVTLTEDVKWWPAPPVGLLFSVKPDGRLEDAFEYTVEDSEEHIKVDWSLRP